MAAHGAFLRNEIFKFDLCFGFVFAISSGVLNPSGKYRVVFCHQRMANRFRANLAKMVLQFVNCLDQLLFGEME